MDAIVADKSAAIRELNDAFRRSFVGGVVLVTAGVEALAPKVRSAVLKHVREFKDFDQANDPHHEHDFASFSAEGHEFFFKVDYYDRDMRMHSPDPSDPAVTTRTLTVMLAEEY